MLSMDVYSTLLTLGCLVSCAQGLVCKVTEHQMGTVTYHISEPFPSSSCEIWWTYPNSTVLANTDDEDSHLVLTRNNQSITTRKCLGDLNYRMDCMQLQLMEVAKCSSNCSMQHNPHVPSGSRFHIWILVPLGVLFVVIIFTLAVKTLRKYAWRSSTKQLSF